MHLEKQQNAPYLARKGAALAPFTPTWLLEIHTKSEDFVEYILKNYVEHVATDGKWTQ